jgi:hypothetical protein
MKEPRVKELILAYKKNNLKGVYEYLTQEGMVVDPSTWSGRIKKLIDAELYLTAKEEIELIGYKFFYLNEHDK